MDRSKKKAKHGKHRSEPAQPHGPDSGAEEGSVRRSPEESTGGRSPWRFAVTWFRRKGPVFRFVVAFTVLTGSFGIFFFAYFTRTELFESYLNLNAELSAWIIRLFGDDARAAGISVVSSRASVQIRHGCDAIFPSALFVGAVLASPVQLMTKLPGMFIGTVVLLTINLVRIISLYYTRIHIPKLFHVMHVDVWQPAFIFLALFFWVLWALRATRRSIEPSHDGP